jgi:hypothetical protein
MEDKQAKTQGAEGSGVEPETMLETIERELMEAERGKIHAHHARSAPQAALEVLAGAAAGAAVGAIAGPPGAIAGAVIGTLVGVAAEVALERDQARAAQREAELDADIGVVGGHIGDAPPNQPPARVGAFSAASMGAGGHGQEPSEGPLQNLDSD